MKVYFMKIFVACAITLSALLLGSSVCAEPSEDLDQKIFRELLSYSVSSSEYNGAKSIIWSNQGAQNTKFGLFYIHGDIINSDKYEKWVLTSFLKRLTRLSRKEPTIKTYLVGLPGYFGTDTGGFSFPKNPDAMRAVARAINQTIEKDGLTRVAIVGQSAGANAAAAHATLGSHPAVQCYALASGGYLFPASVRHKRRQQLDLGRLDLEEYVKIKNDAGNQSDRKTYSPIYFVGGIPRDEGRLFTVLADRRDQITPFVGSEDFFRTLQAAGHRAEFRAKKARDKYRHGLDNSGFIEAIKCLKDGDAASANAGDPL